MTEKTNVEPPDDQGSTSSHCYSVAGEMLGQLTEAIKAKRPRSTLTMNFLLKDEIAFNWSELIGDEMVRWSHRTTFAILDESRDHFVDNMMQAWTNQIYRKIPSESQ